MFILSGTRDLGLTLKSYRASTVNGKSTVTIICETTDHTVLSYSLRGLDEVAADQKKEAARAKAAARAAKKPKPKAPLLALPAPQLALPAPPRQITTGGQ